jgi:uncharacterized protein
MLNLAKIFKMHVKHLLAMGLSFAMAVCTAQNGLQNGASDIARAAKSQIGITLVYDPSYEVISFPGGDVPKRRGVCTDVVVRALRESRQYDLQLEINTDMRKHPGAYPKKWGVTNKPVDSNIDHRRVPNIMAFLERKGYSLAPSLDVSKYLPGDIVSWSLGGGLHHIGIVSDQKTLLGKPLVIHNIGRGTLEENILTDYRILGHYRMPSRLKVPG